ncbi:MAG: hypothetical protein GY810_15155 [Aureispira sp.]|nr:hypothetical protein [Aureispira sp.]
MNKDDDILDDLNDLNEPPPPTAEQIKRRERWSSNIYYLVLFAGFMGVIFILNKRSGSRNREEMRSLNATFKAVQTLKKIEIDVDEIARQQRVVDSLMNSPTVRRFRTRNPQ